MLRSLVIMTGLIALVGTGCGGSKASNPEGSPAPNTQLNPSLPPSQQPGTTAPVTPPSPVPSASPTSHIGAAGWREVEIQANWAKTKIDFTGHFTTDRNACGRDAMGVMTLEFWNGFTPKVNAALKDPVSTEKLCIETPQHYKIWQYSDSVIIRMDDGSSKKLFEIDRSQEICTYFTNRAVLMGFLDALNDAVVLSDKEDADCGWGR